MFDVNHLCPGCMGKWEDAEKPCPHCGFTWEKTDMDLRLIPAFSIIGGRYLLGRGIGAGGFGLIYMAMDLVKETPVAVKEFFPAEMAKREGEQVSPASPEWERGFREALRGFRKEGNALSKAHNIDGIVGFRDFLEENGTCYLVMDYVSGVSLMRHMRETGTLYGQEEALMLMRPVLEAVGKLHKRGILHRDISPENLILSPDGSLTLIDFGAAREYSSLGEENLTVILKQGYAPEEQYRADGRQGPWTDIYACCAVLYQMVSGIRPQNASDRKQKDELIPLEQLPGTQVASSFSHVIEKGMKLNPEDRWSSIEELLAELYPQTDMSLFAEAQKPSLQAENSLKGTKEDMRSLPNGSEDELPENKAAEMRTESAQANAPKSHLLSVKLLAGAAAVIVILCTVIFLNEKHSVGAMEQLSFSIDGQSFELEIPSSLMELCELQTDNESVQMKIQTERFRGTLFKIEKVDSTIAVISGTVPLEFVNGCLYGIDFDELAYLDMPEHFPSFTDRQLKQIREGIRLMQVHTSDKTWTGEELLVNQKNILDSEDLLSVQGYLYDWSLTLPEEMTGAAKAEYGLFFNEDEGTLYEAARVSVINQDNLTARTSEIVFQITVGNVSLDEIDYWYPVEIAENVYLSLATDYGVPVNGDLHEILGSHYDALSDKWNIMLEHLDGIVFTAENGEEIPIAPLLLEMTEKNHSADDTSVSEMIEKVMPSLVAVSHQSAQEMATWFGQGLMYENQNCSSGVILAQTEDEILIVTSNHTIDGAQTLSVGFDDGTTAEAFIKGTDLEHDIAVIGVSLADLSSDTASHISLIQPGSSADLQIDEQVVAVGSELGNGQFMTTGKIKMLNCSMPVDGSPNTLLQTDAAVIPGNAGGALLNMSGQLTGIISARYSETAEDSTSCAIPVDDLYSFVKNLP